MCGPCLLRPHPSDTPARLPVCLRVWDMLKKEALRTRHIKLLILDEADEMLNKNFTEQIYNCYRWVRRCSRLCQVHCTRVVCAVLPQRLLHLLHQAVHARYQQV